MPKTLLRYRYGSQAWVTVDADSYTLVTTPKNYVKLSYSYSKKGNETQTLLVDDAVLGNSPLTFFRDSFGEIQSCRIFLTRPDGSSTFIDVGTGYNFTTGSPIQSSFQTSFITGAISACTLKAFKQGVQVFIRTEPTCPEVEIIELKECPPNTCQVDCGSVYCCYGSDGIAVSSFPK